MEPVKICKRCLRELSVSEFYRHSSMAGGYLNFCKRCTKARVKNHRIKNIDRINAYDRRRYYESEDRQLKTKACRDRWYREDPQRAIASNRSYRHRNPEKYKAHTALNNALRDGKIKKLPCKVCGDMKVHAHHADYSNPLDVTWLCPKHHKVGHRIDG